MLSKIINKEISRQVLSFGLVGLEGAILTYLILIILIGFFSFNYLLAYALGVISGTFFGFFFNKTFSFESKRKVYEEVWKYFLFYAFSLSVGGFLLKFLIETFKINPLIATIPVLILTTITNFFGIKLVVFKNNKW